MRKLFAASGVLFLLFLAMGAQNNKYFGDVYTGLTNAPGLMTDADGKLILGSGPGSPTGGVAVAQSASIITTTNGSVVSPSFSLSASNWIYSLTLGATNEALRHATSLTNGAINNLSNYVLTVSQNSTNQSLLLSLNNTNESLRQATSLTNGAINNLSNLVSTLSVNATNQSLKIGAAATNNDTLISISATNEALRQATALTNGAINNLSNYTLTISQNGTNQSLKIGGAATNNDVLMATGITNGLGAALSNYVSSAANAIARDTGTGTNTSVLIDQTGSFKVSQTNGGSLLLSASNNLVLANTNMTVNGVFTVNSGTNTDWISNMVATGWIVASNTVSALSFQGTVGTTNLAGTVADANLANSAANTGTFGDSTHVAQVTVDTKGRVTAAANVSISGISGLPSGTNGGDMISYHGGNWIVSPLGEYYLSATGTNATATNLSTFVTGKTYLAVPNGYSARIRGDFHAAGATNSAGWTKVAEFRNDAGTLSLVQSNQIAGPSIGKGTNWNVQYIVSGTNILVQGVGDSAETISWGWQGWVELLTNATQIAISSPPDPFAFGTAPFFFAPNTAHSSELGGTSNDVFETTGGVVISASSTNQWFVSFGSTFGSYGVWGNNSYSNGILDATVRLLALQSNGVGGNAQFPSGGWAHGGIGLRYNGMESNDFAGLIMLSAESSTFQIDDRSNGTEIVTILSVPGISYNTDYRLRIENTNGLAANTYLFDASNNLLTNYSYTFNSAVPLKGWPTLHAYGVAMQVKRLEWRDASSNLLTFSSTPWAGVRTWPYTNTPAVVTNGALTLDSTAGGASGWRSILSPSSYTNVQITGTMYRNSGRLGGIVLESDANAQNCYFACYDNNTTVCTIRSGPPEAPTTLNTSSSVTLTAGTGYPFTFTRLNGTNLSWTINGVTVTATNSTLTSGLVGFLTLNGSFTYSNVVVTAQP